MGEVSGDSRTEGVNPGVPRGQHRDSPLPTPPSPGLRRAHLPHQGEGPISARILPGCGAGSRSSPLMGEGDHAAGVVEWVGARCLNGHAPRFTPSVPSGHLLHQGEGPTSARDQPFPARRSPSARRPANRLTKQLPARGRDASFPRLTPPLRAVTPECRLSSVG